MIKNTIKENIGDGVQRVISTAAHYDNKKVQDEALKTAQEKLEQLTPPTKRTITPDIEYGASARKGMERLKYDSINDTFKDRAKALVMGKDSPLQKNIDPSSGINIDGNEKFLRRAKSLNNIDDANNGVAGNAVAQYGRQFQVLQGIPPQKTNNAYENNNSMKIKKGDIFLESKNGLRLKLTGLSENNKKINFADITNGVKYSMKVENFLKAIEKQTLISEALTIKGQKDPQSKEAILELWADALKSLNLKEVEKWERYLRTKFRISLPDLAEYIDGNTKLEDCWRQLQAMRMNENKIKRLKFNKTTFMVESHMVSLIPEKYKIPGEKLAMEDKDGHQYLVEFGVNNQIQILEEKNEKKNKAAQNRIKELYEYNTTEAMGIRDENERMAENTIFLNILNTARGL